MRAFIAGSPRCAVAWQFVLIQSARLRLQTIPLLMVLAAPINCVFADPESADLTKWIRVAEDSGTLQVDFYDPKHRPKSYPGWTDFEFSLEYKFSHRTRWKQAKGNTFAVTIVPTFTSIEPLVSHIIKLPQSRDDTPWHESELGRHELDHVAIGSHPRLMMLATHLLKNMGPLNRSADRVSDVTRKWAEESITIEVSNRRHAVQALISTNNERLDDITRHGGRAIRERAAFFEQLFLKENLDESKFPYIGESLKLLESEEYRKARSLFEY